MKFQVLFAVFLMGTFSISHGGDIPKQKMALIEKAMVAMRLKPRIEGMIDHVATVKVKRIQNDNPGISDSVLSEVHEVIRGVYRENMDGREGLYPQVYKLFDKYLTEDDLKFAVNFNASDAGQRYSKFAPRIAQESIELGKKWTDKLEPEILSRLKDRFGNDSLKIEGM